MKQLPAILAGLRCPCTVKGYRSAPQCWRVRLVPLTRRLANGRRGLMTRPVHLRNRSESIALALGVDSVRVTQDATGLWLEVPKTKRGTVLARELEPPWGMELPVVLGVAVTGQMITLDLARPESPHVLIAGQTGAGKSILLNSIIYNLMRYTSPLNTHVGIVDLTSGLALNTNTDWNGAPHLIGAPIVSDTETTLSALTCLLDVVYERYAGGDDWIGQFVVVVDELADLLSDPVYGRNIEAAIVKLLQIGRRAGIHLILATQRPSTDIVSGSLKANCPVRIALALPSKYDSITILDRRGAEVLGPRGDGLLLLNGHVTRFQAPLVRAQDVTEVVTDIVETYGHYPWYEEVR